MPQKLFTGKSSKFLEGQIIVFLERINYIIYKKFLIPKTHNAHRNKINLQFLFSITVHAEIISSKMLILIPKEILSLEYFAGQSKEFPTVSKLSV